MFFKQLLGIPDVKSRILKDQVGFLKDVVRAYLVRFPFQNITAFGQHKPLDRPAPGIREVITAHFLNSGGLCGHNNVFLKFALQSVGFEAHQVTGCFVRTGVPASHNLCTVRIPKNFSKDEVPKDKMYLIDVGCGVPLSEPICLDDLPYRSRAGGLNFRYEWVDNNTIQRVNECGDAILGEKSPDFKSPQNYIASLTPVQYLDNRDAVEEIFKNVRGSFFHRGLYCFRYLYVDDNDFEIVCICGKEIIFITKETRRTQSYNSYEELKPLVLKYFPMIDSQQVDRTIQNFSLPLEEAIKLSNNYNATGAQ